MKDIYLLLTIVRRKDAPEYEEFYRTEGVGAVYTTPCNGTAHAKTLSLLGIERTEKAMLWSTVTGETLKTLKHHLTVNMKIDLPDRGVAMAVPLSGIGGARTLEYFTLGQPMSDEQQTEENTMQSSHELIVAIYEKGYTDMVMDAAREALNKALTEAGVDSQISAMEKNAEVKPAEKPSQGGTTAVAPAAESTKTAQNATGKENMNLFQKFLQWLKEFGKKN